MYRILFIVLFLTACVFSAGYAQLRKQEPMMKALVDTPRALTLNGFLALYFQYDCHNGGCPNNEISLSWRYGFCEDGRDEKYAYWSYTNKMRYIKYKILLSDLDRIKFGYWDADAIKEELFFRTIAENDRERPTDPFICNTTPPAAEYIVTYIPNINSIRVDLHWKIYCEVIFKLVNQKRCGIYNFDTGTFTEIDDAR